MEHKINRINELNAELADLRKANKDIEIFFAKKRNKLHRRYFGKIARGEIFFQMIPGSQNKLFVTYASDFGLLPLSISSAFVLTKEEGVKQIARKAELLHNFLTLLGNKYTISETLCSKYDKEFKGYEVNLREDLITRLPKEWYPAFSEMKAAIRGYISFASSESDAYQSALKILNRFKTCCELFVQQAKKPLRK